MLETGQYQHKQVVQGEIIPQTAIDDTQTTLLELAVLELAIRYCVNVGISDVLTCDGDKHWLRDREHVISGPQV